MTEHPSNRSPAESDLPAEGEEPAPGAKRKRRLFSGLIRSLKRDRRGDELRDRLEEIIEAADTHREDLAPDERRLLHNILRLHAVTAADVMVPRADISAMELETPLARVIELVKREGHSRFPVYRGALDEIVGMLHVKDLIAHWSQRRGFALEKVLRKVLFAAPSMRVLDLLKEMRISHIHLALVVDEYGGVDGLVTIEDLVEEIVGEIEDEYDVAEELTRVVGPRTLAVAGRTPVAELNERFGLRLPESDDYATIAGLVVERLGHIPKSGEQLKVNDLSISVVRSDARAVRELILNLAQPIRPEHPRRR